VIGYGYSHSTDETPSHSTRLLKDSNQVAGYRLSAEELLMKPLAIPLGCQPKNFGRAPERRQPSGWLWPGTRKTIAKSLVMTLIKRLVKLLAI
jgi:hypothetical protein